MAVNYTYEYRTKTQSFPQIVPDKITYKDLDSSVATIAHQIEVYINAGNYSRASELLNANASKLQGYLISAQDVNRIIEDIRNTQIFALQRQQEITFTNTEPGYLESGDVWIGGGTYI